MGIGIVSFSTSHEGLREAIQNAGHKIVDWQDNWWIDGVPDFSDDSKIVFQGSLGNAAEIEQKLNWSPGAFCPAERFYCSSWYESVRGFLLHDRWVFTTVQRLVQDQERMSQQIGDGSHIFVRPDSPLKPFSGRIVTIGELDLRSLDHGFYYDDLDLPVVVAPVKKVGREWRFIVAKSRVVTGCEYETTARAGLPAEVDSGVQSFAQKVVTQIDPPADVYVLDVCESDGELKLLELNPFGGTDLYFCDPNLVVEAVSRIANNQ